MAPEKPGTSVYFGKLIASRPDRAGKAVGAAALGSLALHTLLIGAAVWVTLALGKEVGAGAAEQITVFEIMELEPTPLPPRPEPPLAQEPLREDVAPAEPPSELPRGFQTLAEPELIPYEIPPPTPIVIEAADFSGEGVEGGVAEGTGTDTVVSRPAALEDGPTITPYDVPPRLKNPDEVGEALLRLYPRVLRQAGVTGTVELWILIDDTGRTVKSEVRISSGRDAFDEAALALAEIMEFTPAENQGEQVAAWIIIPVEFVMR
jgi:protein TonB